MNPVPDPAIAHPAVPHRPTTDDSETERSPVETSPPPQLLPIRDQPAQTGTSTTGTAFGGRRLVGCVCLATAGLSLGLAVLLPTAVYPQLAQLPDDPQINQVQVGTGGVGLVPDANSPTGVRQVRNADVKITTNVTRAPEGSTDPDSVLWQLATRITVGPDLLTARVETVSLDRRTAEPTNCCGDRLITDPQKPQGVLTPHQGFTSFPFNIQKRIYPIWDVQLQRARPAVYIGERRLDGFDTYGLRADTPMTKVGTQALPGSLFGVSDPSVDADSMYADQRTYWVEPATGSVIGLSETINQEFRYNGRAVTALSATLDSPPLSAKLEADTRQGASALPWMRVRATLLLTPIGLLLLLIGLWLLRAPRSASSSALTSAPGGGRAAGY